MVEKFLTRRDGSSDVYVTERALLDDWCAYIMISDAPFKEEISRSMLGLHTVGAFESL